MYQESEPALKILIADDSNSDRLLLKAIVQSQGHQPLLASDGLEAIEVFKQQKPDIILLDALMPNVDGFDTARYVKSHSGDDFVPIIFLTSLSEADSLAHCLEAGGDDFLTKPYNNVVLKAKINAFRRMLKMHVTLQHQRDQIAENNQRLIREQEVAKLTFDKVAHEGCLHVPNIQYTLSPLAVFNGDVLLAAVRPNGNLAVMLGDFTGHGLAAAIGAMPLSQTFYSMVGKGFTIREILVEINRKLKEILPVGVFCCATMIDMDFTAQSLEIWSGGMPESFLYSVEKKIFLPIPARYLALGILEPERFHAETDVYPMQTGDRFYMWSDGILEAMNAEGEMFGEQRLEQIFIDNEEPARLFKEINQTVQKFIGDTQIHDDLSIAEITMIEQDEFAHFFPRNLKKIHTTAMDWAFSYEARAITLRSIDPLPVIHNLLREIPGLRYRSGEVFTVLSELYSNALEHGVLKLDSSMKSTAKGFYEYYRERSKRLEKLEQGSVRFDLDYKGDRDLGCLQLTVTDSGKGFEHEKRLQGSLQSSGYSGRGLLLIKSICDEVTYLGDGNIVQVIFNW